MTRVDTFRYGSSASLALTFLPSITRDVTTAMPTSCKAEFATNGRNSKGHKLVSGGMITHRVIAMSILAAISVGSAEAISAAIVFEDVTRHAGVIGAGPTFGAAWGDFNGDGWPDLWVGNHWRQPTLYLNRRDGTFADITTTVWSGNPQTDAHGAA